MFFLALIHTFLITFHCDTGIRYTKVKVWHKIVFILGPRLTYLSINLKLLETNFNLNCFVFNVSWSPPYLLSILGCGGLRANQICWRCREHHIGVRVKQLHSIGVFRVWQYRWYSTIPNNEQLLQWSFFLGCYVELCCLL